MKTLVLLSLLALPLHAEIRIGARGGVVSGSLAGGIEAEAGIGRWSVAPAYEIIAGGYDQQAFHADLRRRFVFEKHVFWIGAGPTWVRADNPASATTWNVDAAYGWRHGAWETFVAARYFSYRIPVFRDVLEVRGPEVAFGISRRLH